MAAKSYVPKARPYILLVIKYLRWGIANSSSLHTHIHTIILTKKQQPLVGRLLSEGIGDVLIRLFHCDFCTVDDIDAGGECFDVGCCSGAAHADALQVIDVGRGVCVSEDVVDA